MFSFAKVLGDHEAGWPRYPSCRFSFTESIEVDRHGCYDYHMEILAKGLGSESSALWKFFRRFGGQG